MNHIKVFEKFLNFKELNSEKLENEFSEIVVSGLIGKYDKYWSCFTALKIELGEFIDEDDPLYKELMYRVVEGENPTDVIRDIFTKVGLSTRSLSEAKRLLGRLQNFKRK